MRKKILIGVLCAVTMVSMLCACGKDKQQIKIESWTEEPSVSRTEPNSDGVSYSPMGSSIESSELPTSSENVTTPTITESTIIVDNVGEGNELDANNTEIDTETNVENQINDSSSEGIVSTTTP